MYGGAFNPSTAASPPTAFCIRTFMAPFYVFLPLWLRSEAFFPLPKRFEAPDPGCLPSPLPPPWGSTCPLVNALDFPRPCYYEKSGRRHRSYRIDLLPRRMFGRTNRLFQLAFLFLSVVECVFAFFPSGAVWPPWSAYDFSVSPRIFSSPLSSRLLRGLLLPRRRTASLPRIIPHPQNSLLRCGGICDLRRQQFF